MGGRGRVEFSDLVEEAEWSPESFTAEPAATRNAGVQRFVSQVQGANQSKSSSRRWDRMMVRAD